MSRLLKRELWHRDPLFRKPDQLPPRVKTHVRRWVDRHPDARVSCLSFCRERRGRFDGDGAYGLYVTVEFFETGATVRQLSEWCPRRGYWFELTNVSAGFNTVDVLLHCGCCEGR